MIPFLLIIGLALLYFGAELLVKGAVAVARHLGIGPLAIGLTIVAFGTSAPELTVSIQAALAGSGDIAAANVVGSNIFNVAAILGLSALICPIRVTAQVIRVDMPILIFVSLAGLAVLANKYVSRIEGLLLCSGALGYTILSFYLAGRAASENLSGQFAQMLDKPPLKPAAKWPLSATAIVLGLVLLVLGSKAFVEGAVRLAGWIGLSDAVIGLTLISIGTSLPELATSVVAAARRQPDIAVGNIVGSNIFNILAILGLSSALTPYTAAGLSGVDLGMMAAVAIIALPLMWSRFTLSRLEGGILLLGYVLYMAWLWPR